ncbi:MAG: helix-turn-helix domain-containing protein [Actinomycetia bacterium]|nr:helix-turn-helix domain-containing protein [Actinomycetes bacterium]
MVEMTGAGSASAERLGSTIRRERQRLGMTQVDLAELLGIDREYLALTEGGSHPKYFDRLVRMLDAVGLKLIVSPKTLDVGIATEQISSTDGGDTHS